MTQATTRPVAVKLDQDTRDRIKRLADARDRTTHWVLREAVVQYLGREERNEALRQDALKAWAAYQADGLHLTHEEADAWLAGLQAGRDELPPECHA